MLRSQGMTGQISSRNLKVAAGETGGLPKMTTDREGSLWSQRRNLLSYIKESLWSQRRSLPSYISARSFADAVIDLVVPDASGQTTMTTIQQSLKTLPETMTPF